MARGGDDFLRMSKHLKAAGEKGLRSEFHRAVEKGARPVIPKIRAAARRDLPTAGGLNTRTARKPLRAQTRTGELTAGVRIVGTRVDPRINAGRVWHPVFGRKGKPKGSRGNPNKPGRNSVVQAVPKAEGYFDDTIRESAPEVLRSIEATLEDWADRLMRKDLL